MIKDIKLMLKEETVKKETLEFLDILKMLHIDCKNAINLFHKWRRKILEQTNNISDRSLKSKIKKYIKETELIFSDELNQIPEYYNYIHHLNY